MALEDEKAALDKQVRELTSELKVRVDDIDKKEVGRKPLSWDEETSKLSKAAWREA